MEDKLENIEDKLKGIEKKLTGLLEINNRLAMEIIGIKSGTTPTVSNITGSSEDILIEKNDSRILISGKTYTMRGLFRDMGGNWVGDKKKWELCQSQLEHLVSHFDSNNVSYKIN